MTSHFECTEFDPTFLTLGKQKATKNGGKSFHLPFIYNDPRLSKKNLSAKLPVIETGFVKIDDGSVSGSNKQTIKCNAILRSDNPDHVKILDFYTALHERVIDLMVPLAEELRLKKVADDYRQGALMELPLTKFLKELPNESDDPDAPKSYCLYLEFLDTKTKEGKPFQTNCVGVDKKSIPFNSILGHKLKFCPIMNFGLLTRGPAIKVASNISSCCILRMTVTENNEFDDLIENLNDDDRKAYNEDLSKVMSSTTDIHLTPLPNVVPSIEGALEDAEKFFNERPPSPVKKGTRK